MSHCMGKLTRYDKGYSSRYSQAICAGIIAGMIDPADKFLAGLRKIMAERGLKEATLSEAAGMNSSYLRDLKRGKAASPKLSTALRIADHLGMSVDQIIGAADRSVAPGPTIAIAGTVGAGAQVPLVDVYEKGDGPHVLAPQGLGVHGIVAVEVEGDSMEPTYSSGDILFYSRETHDGVPSEALGHTCVCEDENGMVWVKQVKLGSEPGLFHLISLNPQSDNIHDVSLKWASRVRLHWPRDLAVKL